MKKKTVILFIIFVIITATGDALAFKANVGVVPYEALALTLNYLLHIEVGNLSFIVNLCMIVAQIVLNKKWEWKYLLQMVMIMMFSVIINFIVYFIFGNIQFDYFIRIILMIFGILISACGVGMLVALNAVVFPCEGFALALSKKYNLNFERVRQGIDIIFLCGCIVISLIFRLNFAIREGTVFAAIFYAPVMGMIKRKIQPIIEKL